ncbi:MAG: thymidylate synthase [Bacteroidales bacterium]|nr:thymidylate synthase [Candidatus Colimorpha pelethequi]
MKFTLNTILPHLIDVHSRAEFYAWMQQNHDKEQECWVRSNRSEKPFPNTIWYVDAVEVALCFGWIDSTQKRIDDGKPIQRFTPRRKGCIWCEQNVERCRRLIRLGEMTPAGLAVLPDMNPDHFVFCDWVIDAIKADALAWKHYQEFPDAYKRIKIWRIQHYEDTKRHDEAVRTLQKFIQDTHDGRLQKGWNDCGRLGF